MEKCLPVMGFEILVPAPFAGANTGMYCISRKISFGCAEDSLGRLEVNSEKVKQVKSRLAEDMHR